MVAGWRRWPLQVARLWRDDRRRLLHEALLVFLALGFLLPAERVWADLFYVILLPLALAVAWQRRSLWRRCGPPVHVVLGGGLILVFALSLTWDQTARSDPVLLWYWGWASLCTFVFVLALADALAARGAYRRRLVEAIVAAAAVNAALSVARFLLLAEGWSSDPTRLGGWAETRQPILGAVMMGLAVLLAADRALRTERRRYGAAAGLGLLFIALTGSRGPALAILLSLALLLGGSRPKLFLSLIAAAALAIGCLAVVDPAVIGRVVGAALLRGDSHRLAIWQLSWHDIRLRPWFGHGPAYRIAMPGEDFPHNLFLSTWLYTGVVGLALLLTYMAAVLRQVLRVPMPDRLLRLAILAHLLISALTDLGQAIRGPGPLWYIFWLGTLFCAANGSTAPDGRREAGGHGSQASR